jgi:hypothetical protein
MRGRACKAPPARLCPAQLPHLLFSPHHTTPHHTSTPCTPAGRRAPWPGSTSPLSSSSPSSAASTSGRSRATWPCRAASTRARTARSGVRRGPWQLRLCSPHWRVPAAAVLAALLRQAEAHAPGRRTAARVPAREAQPWLLGREAAPGQQAAAGRGHGPTMAAARAAQVGGCGAQAADGGCGDQLCDQLLRALGQQRRAGLQGQGGARLQRGPSCWPELPLGFTAALGCPRHSLRSWLRARAPRCAKALPCLAISPGSSPALPPTHTHTTHPALRSWACLPG